MQRLQQLTRYADWLAPLHEIAMEQAGLSDFGEDDSYLTGLRVILEALDEDCDLNEAGRFAVPFKLVHCLKQRLLAEQAFKERPELLERPIEQPLVITGLVRTGSTALHYLMARDPNRQHLQYWLAEHPMPRPPAQTWADLAGFQESRHSLELMYRMSPKLKAIHYMAPDWPEECGHLLAHTFTDDYWQCTRSAPRYNRWYEGVDMVPSYHQHRRLLQLIGANEPDKPWLLKYPVHMKHLDSFLKVYPDARIVWTHRDPVEVMSSYVSLIAGFRELSVRPERIDRDEILQEQTAIWASAAERAIAVRKAAPEAQFCDVYFDDFVADPVGTVRNIYEHFGIEWTPACEAALQQWHERNPQHKHGVHAHDRSGWESQGRLVRERFAGYLRRFPALVR